MAELSKDGVLADRWRPVFRHSAGRLGSEYLTAIRSQHRLLGWKTQQPDMVTAPPKNFGGAGEWVELGPEATLLSFAPTEWVADCGEALLKTFVLGRVLVDGGDAPIFALLKPVAGSATPKRGDRLTVRFAEGGAAEGGPAGPDFWFEPAVAGAGS